MKSNLLTTVLNWVLAASVILSIIFLWQFFSRTHDLRALQPQLQVEVAKYQAVHGSLNLLMNDLNEYSKRNKDILPILESVKPKPASNAPPAAPNTSGK